MQITVDGTTYDYDESKMLVSEAVQLKCLTRLNLRDWKNGLQEMDPEAVKGLVFLAKRRAGEQPDWAALDFDLGSLEVTATPTDDDVAAAAAQEATDPSPAPVAA